MLYLVVRDDEECGEEFSVKLEAFLKLIEERVCRKTVLLCNDTQAGL
jgi:hypothetical protein